MYDSDQGAKLGFFFVAFGISNVPSSKDIHSRITLHGFDGKVVTFRYVVDKADCNLMGTLHGGAIATMADNLTTYAAIIEDRHLRPGVSVTLEVDYMRAPKAGEVVLIECKLDKTGAYLSFSSADFLTEKVHILSEHILFFLPSSFHFRSPLPLFRREN